MHTLKSVVAAAAIGCALIGSAAAMPADHLSAQSGISVEKAAWVCGAYGRCWWRPGPRYYGYYGRPYGYYGRPYYWRRGYYRW